eukprot:3136280-Amphidinium_carterae.1
MTPSANTAVQCLAYSLWHTDSWAEVDALRRLAHAVGAHMMSEPGAAFDTAIADTAKLLDMSVEEYQCRTYLHTPWRPGSTCDLHILAAALGLKATVRLMLSLGSFGARAKPSRQPTLPRTAISFLAMRRTISGFSIQIAGDPNHGTLTTLPPLGSWAGAEMRSAPAAPAPRWDAVASGHHLKMCPKISKGIKAKLIHVSCPFSRAAFGKDENICRKRVGNSRVSRLWNWLLPGPTSNNRREKWDSNGTAYFRAFAFASNSSGFGGELAGSQELYALCLSDASLRNGREVHAAQILDESQCEQQHWGHLVVLAYTLLQTKKEFASNGQRLDKEGNT